MSNPYTIIEITNNPRVAIADKLHSFLIAASTSIVLGLVLVWCQFAALPPVAWLYWVLSRLIGGDLSLVNSSKYQERFIALPLARPLHFVITYFDRKP